MLTKIFKKIEYFIPERYHWILDHAGFKRYFANTGWMFFGQIFSLLVSFFIGAWVARYLGPSNYGVLSYAVAFVGLFAFISDLGSGGILNRELVKHPEQRDELMGTTFRLKLIGGSLAMILAVGTSLVIKMSPLARLLIIVFSVSSILQVMNVISIYFQAKVEAKNNTWVMTTAIFISALLKVGVILSNRGVIWIIVIYILDLIWQGMGYIIIYRRQGLRISKWRFESSLVKEIWQSSWPLMLAAFSGYIYSRIDQVMIGSILGNREVGLYAAGVKLVEVWYFIPGMISVSLFPAIINARKTDKKIYGQRLKMFYVFMIILALAIIIPMTLLAKPVVYYLFGNKFLASVAVLRIYIWSNLGLFLWWALSRYLMTEDKVRTIFVVNLFAMIVNVILNLIFIPTLGLVGAAWATLISYLSLPVGVWGLEKWGFMKGR